MSCFLPHLCIVHFAQHIRKQLTRRRENKGFLVVWQHALLLIKIWNLEFITHTKQQLMLNNGSQTFFVCVSLPPFAYVFCMHFFNLKSLDGTYVWKGHKKTLCCLTFSSLVGILRTILFL